MMATLPFTALLCCYQLAQGRKISYGTVLAGAMIAPVLMAIAATLISPEIWFVHEGKSSPRDFVVIFRHIAILCVLPALAVVILFQQRSKTVASAL
jgi:hypothetical protein